MIASELVSQVRELILFTLPTETLPLDADFALTLKLGPLPDAELLYLQLTATRVIGSPETMAAGVLSIFRSSICPAVPLEIKVVTSSGVISSMSV